jgi:hypothetical protein
MLLALAIKRTKDNHSPCKIGGLTLNKIKIMVSLSDEICFGALERESAEN